MSSQGLATHRRYIAHFCHECWWDCQVISDTKLRRQAIANPECLRDCVSKSSTSSGSGSNSSCWVSLIEDVTTKGTCDNGNNPAAELDMWGWSELPNSCELEEIEDYPAHAQSVRAPRACALRALGLLPADGAPTVGRGKTF